MLNFIEIKHTWIKSYPYQEIFIEANNIEKRIEIKSQNAALLKLNACKRSYARGYGPLRGIARYVLF